MENRHPHLRRLLILAAAAGADNAEELSAAWEEIRESIRRQP